MNTDVPVSRVLLTGFTAFDGRQVNAAWIAARRLASKAFPALELRALEIDVCWGAPRQQLEPVLRDWQPHCIISMGEGEPGGVRLETVARNRRKIRADNLGQYPAEPCIDPAGPTLHLSSADCAAIQSTLSQTGIPIELSRDAGAFLCEELLYTLETLRKCNKHPKHVLFVHVPPYATELMFRGERRQCDESLLDALSYSLLEAACRQFGILRGEP